MALNGNMNVAVFVFAELSWRRGNGSRDHPGLLGAALAASVDGRSPLDQ